MSRAHLVVAVALSACSAAKVRSDPPAIRAPARPQPPSQLAIDDVKTAESAHDLELDVSVPAFHHPSAAVTRELAKLVNADSETAYYRSLAASDHTYGRISVTCTATAATTALVSVVCLRYSEVANHADDGDSESGGAGPGPAAETMVVAIDGDAVRPLTLQQVLSRDGLPTLLRACTEEEGSASLPVCPTLSTDPHFTLTDDGITVYGGPASEAVSVRFESVLPAFAPDVLWRAGWEAPPPVPAGIELRPVGITVVYPDGGAIPIISH